MAALEEIKPGSVVEGLVPEREALQGKVFDVLGRLFTEVALRDLMLEAIRYNSTDEGRAKMRAKIDSAWTKETLDGVQATGLTAIVRTGEQGWLCGTGALLLRSTSAELCPQYLALRLSAPQSVRWLKSHAVGAVMPNLNESILRQFPVEFPPLLEQRATAGVLGALDDKIELNRRTNETLEEIARALFKSWFVDFDPVRAKSEGRQPWGMDAGTAALFPSEFDDSELGKIPNGWQVGRLDDIADVTMGQSPLGDTYNEARDGLPFYQGTRDFGWRFPAHRVWCNAPTRLAEAGDSLLSVRAPVGELNVARERCAVGRGVAAVRPRTGFRGFLHYALQLSQSGWDKFEAEGTVFGSASKADVTGFPVVVSDARTELAFGRLVEPVDARILNDTAESETLAELRDTLLPKLMSGAVRVRDAERAVEVVG
ncbi:MAG: restriction endonuclease subunit S [Dehalococcoidia bacterium]